MSFSDEVIVRCKELAAVNYSDEAVWKFIEDYPVGGLLKTLINVDLAAEKNFQPRVSLQQILSNKRVFIELLNDQNNRILMDQLVSHSYEEQREFVALVVSQNVGASCEILISYAHDQVHPSIGGFIDVVYYLLKDNESEVGLKLSKWFVNVLFSNVDGQAHGDR